MSLTLQEFARLGGKARWKGISKEERKKKMSKLAHISKNKRRQAKEGVSKPKLEHE